jgi:hypothetical protein
MRSRIEESIAKALTSSRVVHRTSDDSLLVAGWPPVARAVRTMENSWRTSPLLV